MVEIIDQFKQQTWFVAQGDISLDYEYIHEKHFRYRIISINSPYFHCHPTTVLIRVFLILLYKHVGYGV
jgi:hypothetical protein